MTDAAPRYLAHLLKRYGRSLYLPEAESEKEQPDVGTSADPPMQDEPGSDEEVRAPAPPPPREPGTPEPAERDKQHKAANPDPYGAPGQRPPSWAEASALPSLGCWCSCCRGQRWWCERADPKGWRCGSCHPPDHLSDTNVRWIETQRR
jgi:hypothetical protein